MRFYLSGSSQTQLQPVREFYIDKDVTDTKLAFPESSSRNGSFHAWPGRCCGLTGSPCQIWTVPSGYNKFCQRGHAEEMF